MKELLGVTFDKRKIGKKDKNSRGGPFDSKGVFKRNRDLTSIREAQREENFFSPKVVIEITEEVEKES